MAVRSRYTCSKAAKRCTPALCSSDVPSVVANKEKEKGTGGSCNSSPEISTTGMRPHVWSNSAYLCISKPKAFWRPYDLRSASACSICPIHWENSSMTMAANGTVLHSSAFLVSAVTRRCTVRKDESLRSLLAVCIVLPWICRAALFEGACACMLPSPNTASNNGRSTMLMMRVFPQPPPPTSRQRSSTPSLESQPFAAGGKTLKASCNLFATIATNPSWSRFKPARSANILATAAGPRNRRSAAIHRTAASLSDRATTGPDSSISPCTWSTWRYKSMYCCCVRNKVSMDAPGCHPAEAETGKFSLQTCILLSSAFSASNMKRAASEVRAPRCFASLKTEACNKWSRTACASRGKNDVTSVPFPWTSVLSPTSSSSPSCASPPTFSISTIICCSSGPSDSTSSSTLPSALSFAICMAVFRASVCMSKRKTMSLVLYATNSDKCSCSSAAIVASFSKKEHTPATSLQKSCVPANTCLLCPW